MLYIKFTHDEDYIHGIDSFFNHSYEDEWFEDPIVKQIVKDIDNTEIVSPNLAISPVLGPIPPTKISGGSKAVIQMLKRPVIISNITGKQLAHPGNSCGDNCASWIYKISKMRDILLHLTYNMKFPDDVELTIVETGTVCKSREEFVKEWFAWDFFQ